MSHNHNDRPPAPYKPANEERVERLGGLLEQAQAVLKELDLSRRPSAADHFVQTLQANVGNDKLSDADFRAFVRNSLPDVLKRQPS